MADPTQIGFTPPVPVPKPLEAEPTFGEGFAAGFQMENDVLNAIELMSQPAFKPNAAFDYPALKTRLKKEGLWDDWRDNFIGVRSNEEFTYKMNKIAAEQKTRETFARSGRGGIVGGLAAGVLSPTMFIPLVGQARGAKAFYDSARLALLAGAINEVPLQLNQETRTTGESALNVGAQTIIGAILGGVVKNLTKSELDKLSFDMARSPGEPYRSVLGAQASDSAVERLKPVNGTFRINRDIDLDSPQPFIRTDGKPGVRTFDFEPKNALVVSPRSLKLMSEEGEILTQGEIVSAAKANGHDAVIFEGFEGPERISAAAIRYKGKVYTDLNHTDATMKAVKATGDDLNIVAKATAATDNDGFVTSTGRYVTRQEAVQVAERAEQLQAEFADIKHLMAHSLRKVSDLEDGIVILDKAILKAGVHEGPSIMPRFGDGVEKVLVDPESGKPVVESGLSGSVGAKSIPFDVGGLKWGPGVHQLAKVGPVTAVIDQKVFPYDGWFMAQLSDAGTTMASAAKGIAAAPGGTVENLAETYYGLLPPMVRMFEKNYADFVYGDSAAKFWKARRAKLGSALGQNEMSVKDFSAEVSRYMRHHDGDDIPDAIPEIMATAKALRADLFEPLYKEAVKAGLFKGTEDVIGDSTYLTRAYNHEAIEGKLSRSDGTGFVDRIEQHALKKLNADFAKRFEKWLLQSTKDEQFVSDASLGVEETTKLRDQFIKELDDLDKKTDPNTKEIEEQMMELRSQVRDPDLTPEAKVSLKEKLKEFEALGGEPLAEFKFTKRQLKRRINNLNRSQVIFEQQQLAKLEKIDRTEELSIGSLNRAIRAGQRFIAGLDELSDEALDAELSKFRTTFAQAAKTFDAGEEQLVKLADTDGPAFDVAAQELRQLNTADKLSTVANKIGDLEDFDRDLWRKLVQEAMDQYSQKVVSIISRRGARSARLAEQAKALDPKVAEEFLKKIKARIPERRLEFQDFMRERGADDIDIKEGTADFRKKAREIAHEVKDTILGTNSRLPAIDIIQSRHGILNARTLDMSAEEIGEEFLENDVMKLARIYLHTIAGDVAVAKRFGTPNAAQQLLASKDAYNAKIDQFKNVTKDSKGKPISAETRAKMEKEITAQYNFNRIRLEAILGRIRHTRILPGNPSGISYRLAKVALDANTTRLMGTVVPSSFSDLGRPVMKFGLTSTFRDGLIPLITDFKGYKAAAEEAELNGVGIDLLIHTRAHQWSDVTDDTIGRTKFERGLHYAAAHMGVVAGFDLWTQEAKKLTAVIATAKMTRAIETVVTGTGSARRLAKDTEYLAKLNITGDAAEAMWKVINTVEGGGRMKGRLLPNTKYWQDRDLAHTFGQAIVGQLNSTIVTPGVERALWMDATMTGKLIGQFRSFGMSSVSKTVIAGLQDRDLATLNGVMISLALGALSYYVWAVSIGGDAYQEMLDAPLEKWADEMVDRSGLLAAGNEFWHIAQRIPGLAPYASFAGGRTSQREGAALADLFFGPTYDLVFKKGAGVVMGLDDPTQNTARLMRSILPFQNVFYLRQLLTQVEEASGLPERRQ